jgi:Cu2+-exporting ATPase
MYIALMLTESVAPHKAVAPSAIVTVDLHCLHCDSLIPGDFDSKQFCCRGCEFVYGLIHHENLQRFYYLKDHPLAPVRSDWNDSAYLDWIKLLPGRERGLVTVSVEGIQCTACIWLIRELARRCGFQQCSIDSVRSSLALKFDPVKIELVDFFLQLQKFGYRTGPARPKSLRNEMSLLLRLGVVGAIAMNSMTLSLCFYFGLNASESGLFRFFNQLNLILAFSGVLFGGSYFFVRAWEGLKRRIVHFDTTVSIGIILGIVASTYNLYHGAADFTYFDSLNGFIALMLLGRFVQAQTLERHQRKIVAHAPLAEHPVLRQILTVSGEKTFEQIFFGQVSLGDLLVIPSKGIVPVCSELLAPESLEFQLNWINGESFPQLFHRTEQIPAGAQLASRTSANVRALESFTHSRLYTLDASAASSESNDPLPGIWTAITKWYVPIVLLFALLAFVIWMRSDIHKALQAAIAVMVVTCPCALGIAVPLARTLANRLMSEHGVFVRSTYFFERLRRLKKIVFDKTGTLTFADLILKNRDIIPTIPKSERQVLLAMVAGSNHPASQTLLKELLPMSLTPATLTVSEEPGAGLHAVTPSGVTYYLGRDQGLAASTESQEYRVIWSCDETMIAAFEFSEAPIDGLPATIQWLQHRGIATYLCSGDRLERVENFAKTIGIDPANVVGAASPERKAVFVESLDRGDTLYLGDGINDALAIQRAAFRGTPSRIATEGMAGGTDLVFHAPHLRWLPRLIQVAAAFRRTLWMNLVFVFVYNILTLGLALSGRINPLMAALLMPTSSLFIVLISLVVMGKADLNHGAQ